MRAGDLPVVVDGVEVSVGAGLHDQALDGNGKGHLGQNVPFLHIIEEKLRAPVAPRIAPSFRDACPGSRHRGSPCACPFLADRFSLTLRMRHVDVPGRASHAHRLTALVAKAALPGEESALTDACALRMDLYQSTLRHGDPVP